jgi:hypothetical protein
MPYGLEPGQALKNHDGPRLAVVSCPFSEPGTDPSRIGQRPRRTRVLLFLGLALQSRGNRFEGWLILCIEDILQRPAGDTVTFVDQCTT